MLRLHNPPPGRSVNKKWSLRIAVVTRILTESLNAVLLIDSPLPHIPNSCFTGLAGRVFGLVVTHILTESLNAVLLIDSSLPHIPNSCFTGLAGRVFGVEGCLCFLWFCDGVLVDLVCLFSFIRSLFLLSGCF
ncbi:hypothetical protein RHMOL_Rhmol05G0126200 [Rhododendron molle]|uniref:Uncharacterized protein n=1 Tax=Rhododendron molle TaxID=49168 RepID=A0ACC0NQR2_RHOML|nr:hypothetical protein RHMOL_Rhmol05G0126200 [Rhododendron molle]